MARLPSIRAQVALATRHRIGGWTEGVHSAINAGRSFDFHDVREYVRGDDTSDIDWKASARRGQLLVKRHVAERRTTLMVAAATGRSMAAMASPSLTKRDLMIDAAATLAALALAHGDYVGMMHWTGAGAQGERPSTRAVRAERMLGSLEAASGPDTPDADLDRLLDLTATSMRRRGIVAVICGDLDVDAQLEARLRRLVTQHEVLLFVVPDVDPTASELAGPGLIGIHDRRRLPVGLLADAGLGAAWQSDVADRAARRSAALARLAISSTTLEPDGPVVPQVLATVRRMRRAA